jgi:uncharacterized membrane protein YkvA (DUF1232 family)
MIIKSHSIRPWMLKKEIFILYYGLRDRRTGFLPKLTTFISVIYLLSPIDIIPDFIPVLGYLDDLLIVPLLLNLAIRLLPPDVRNESILKADKNRRTFKLLIFLVIILIICLLAGIFMLIRHLMNPGG